MLIPILIILLVVSSISVFLREPKFGKAPQGERLERIKRSPHYKDGEFKNQSETPQLTDGGNYLSIMYDFLFKKNKNAVPSKNIPSVKTDLKKTDPMENMLVWFGHSSYFMQLDGKKFLVDPVFSGHASPLSFTTKAFPGTDQYSAADMPEIDYLFLTHDHWDHLDYDTIIALKPKIKKIVCPLGLGQHLEHWGYKPDVFSELDWNESLFPEPGIVVDTVTARHFSGRTFKRNQSLWTSYVLKTPSLKVFIGGDSGYDKHFAEAGKKFGPFDLVILENGQYNKYWKHIHLMPEEFLQAAKDLDAKSILPVHSGKFSLSLHNWDEPLRKVTENNRRENLRVITPMIGEKVRVGDSNQTFSTWWEGATTQV